MTDHDMRAQLLQLIADLDAGRVTVPRRRPARLPVGGTMLVAALGLGLTGCGSSKPQTTSPDPSATSTSTAPAPAPMYGAPAPDRPIDDGAQTDYMAPDAEPEPLEPEPQPLYAVEMD